MGIIDQLLAYKAQVNNDVSTQSDPDSIAPDAVGSIGTDLADILIGVLPRISVFGINGGTALPVGGQPNDIYFKSNLNEIAIYRNENGTWALKSTIPLGIAYPDGIIIGLRSSISAYIVTVSSGTWAISNALYSKSTQTQLTVDPKDLNYGRWDLIYANNANQVLLLKGVASNVPAKPVLPANSIVIDYVYVPPIGSPFLLSGSISSSGTGGAAKTTVAVPDGDKVINWQTDIIPNDVVPYAQKHGNSIGRIEGHQDIGGGTMLGYSPNYTYTLNGDGTINILTITDLFAGTITII